MSTNNKEIEVFYQDCNKLLKDITIEWIKEDGSIGETIKGNEVLEYIVFNYSGNSYITTEELKYKYYLNNKSYNCLYNLNSQHKFIGFQNIKNNKLFLKLSNNLFCGVYKSGIYSNKECNVYASQREFKDKIYNMYNDNNCINQDINQKILSVIVMLLNSVDYKFYKFSDKNLFINLSSGLEDDFKGYECKDKTPFYKTLQVKYNTNIIFKMTIDNYKDQIFNCIYDYNGKIIQFNLFDFHCDSLHYYNYDDNRDITYKLYSTYIPFLNHPYGTRVFYNVKYSLENKLINQVSETSINQEFINYKNYNNQLLQKNQEIEELKKLLQEKSNFNEIQDNLINSLTKTLQDFKEKYENQLKILQDEFEKLKSEHIEKYNISLKEFNNNSEEIKKLKEENETNKQKLDEILSENLQLKEENEMFNKEILEMVQISRNNFNDVNKVYKSCSKKSCNKILDKNINYVNKVSKSDLIQLKETFNKILDKNINLNNKLKQKEDKIKQLQERINKLHNQNDKLNDEIERLKSETQKIDLYKKQLIDLSKNILNVVSLLKDKKDDNKNEYDEIVDDEEDDEEDDESIYVSDDKKDCKKVKKVKKDDYEIEFEEEELIYESDD